MAAHTWASRAAVAVTTLLAFLQLFWAGVRADHGTAVGIAVFLGAATLLAAVALARINVFEARLAVCILCSVQIGLMLLALTWGLPGHEPRPFDHQAVVALITSTTVLLLLAVDGRHRPRSPEPTPVPPYAL